MSGEIQTIPARHGVATFVPRGRTIKIINTYGKQVVSTWAFGLHAPPEEGDDEEEEDEVDEEEIEEKTKELEKEVSKQEEEAKPEQSEQPESSKGKEKEIEQPKEDAEQGESSKETQRTGSQDEEFDDPPEQAPDTPENEKTTETTQEKQTKKTEKRTWSSYLPSIPYRNKGAVGASKESKPDPEAEKAANEATSKKWSSYLPTGKSFSSYVPNVQMPDSKGIVSAFQATHPRDPNKSYAEQLYEFSKTPVGAGSIAVATGSGTASSIYAAYSAYTKMSPSKADQPPMEYLSLPHTRASSHRLVPEVDDTLLTNLRNPIMTLIEDTSPGAHDTLTAACDASQYAALGVDSPEVHGSCAVNLVLALKELNEKAGLKGTKAVGADITVNIAPTPLHLFMNAPIEIDDSAQSEGSGARGSKLKVDEPKGNKRSFVRFRAERDIVIVMSACPMEVGKQNGGRCMAANFMVEEATEESPAASTKSLKKPKKLGAKKDAPKEQDSKKEEAKKETPKPKDETPKEPEAEKEKPKRKPVPRGGPSKFSSFKKPEAQRSNSNVPDKKQPDPAPKDSKAEKKEPASKDASPKPEETPKPKKKPKKLERRSAGDATPTKSETS